MINTDWNACYTSVYALYNQRVEPVLLITTSSFNVLMIVFVVVTHKLHYTVCVVHRLFAYMHGYEKRVRDVEKQRGQLLEEMDSREGELLKRIDDLEDDKRVLERRLKKSVSERDHYNELNTILSSENDRYCAELIVVISLRNRFLESSFKHSFIIF